MHSLSRLWKSVPRTPMAKRQVEEVACTRCDRTEYRPIEESNVDADPLVVAAFEATLMLPDGPMKINFADLCTPCKSTVAGHLSQIGKKIEGVSPMRQKNGAKKKQEAEV